MGIVVGTVTTSSSTSLTLDLNALTTRVANLLRRDDINSEIEQWLNFVQREMADEINFPELRVEFFTPLVDGQFRYTLPSDFMRDDKVFYLDNTVTPTWGRELGPLPRKMYEDLGLERLTEVTEPSKGDPVYYLIDNTDLYLWPVPNKAARIELGYYKLPTDMTLGTHSPVFKARWRHYMIYLAYYWGQIFIEKADINKVQVWENKYNRTMKRLRRLVYRTENRNVRFLTPSIGTERADKIY